MTLTDDLITSVHRRSSVVRDVRVGYLWIGVLTRGCGMAKNYGYPHSSPPRSFGRLQKKKCSELLSYARSWNPLEAGIGIATVNSLIDVRGKKGNALDIIREMGRNKRIAMIGHFPGTQGLQNEAKKLWILERDPQPGDLPDTAAEYLIPRADIVAITGSAIINKSMERLLELSKDKYAVVMGPSTPMSKVLFDYGASLLAGVKIKNPNSLMQKISEGGGMVRHFMDDIEFRVMEE